MAITWIKFYLIEVANIFIIEELSNLNTYSQSAVRTTLNMGGEIKNFARNTEVYGGQG